MEEIKQISIDANLTEIQLWIDSKLVGAGAWHNPITKEVEQQARTAIIKAWLL